MHDLIIIGAGPAGLSMATEARAAGIHADKLLVLEKGEAHSWSIRKFYPEAKLVEANYKGKPAVCSGVLCIADMSKEQTLTYLDQAIAQHDLDVHYKESVHSITRQADASFLVRSSSASYQARVCVIAIGILGRPNKPDYKIPPKLRKRVHFDVTSEDYRDQDILVVGGGDSASEYVQYLLQADNRVTLSYRRETFERMSRLNRESLLALEQRSEVELLRGTHISQVIEAEGRPRVEFAEDEQGQRTFDYIIYALGGSTPDNFLRAVGIEFEGKAPKLNEGYETSLEGLYLIGDLSPGSGSIIGAFNTARGAMADICDSHLGCELRAPQAPGAMDGKNP